MRLDAILLAHTFLCFQHGDSVVAGVAFHPSPIFGSPLGQDLRGDGILAMHVAEEIYDVFGARQQRQVSLDDDAVETVIYKNQEAFKELRESFHRSPPQKIWLDTKIICLGDRWNQPRAPEGSRPPLLGISRAKPVVMSRGLSSPICLVPRRNCGSCRATLT